MLIVKACVWNLWLARNDCIFNACVLPVHAIIVKINHMLLSWFSAASEGTKKKLADPISTIRRSLEFLGSRSLESSDVHGGAEIQDHGMG